MRYRELIENKTDFVEIFNKFLPLAKKIIGLDSLPKIKIEKEIYSPDQPTFGKYVNDTKTLHVGLANRHPVDILRTVAHELVHYKQDLNNDLDHDSGRTGSPEENEANQVAGIVMRIFNKKYPQYLKSKPIFESIEDDDNENLPSVNMAKSLIPRILIKVQETYDNWDEEDLDTYAGGGICHLIADDVCGILSNKGIDCTTVSCSHEQHVYVAAKFSEGVYTIDIPYHIYETGGGFSWKKISGIKFDINDVVFYRTSSDPDDFKNYIDF
jgi:hypothetical protein